MAVDLDLDFNDVKIRALFGRHNRRKSGYLDICNQLAMNNRWIDQPLLADLQTYGSLDYRNYLLTLPNGTKILICGSEPRPEQLNLCKQLQPDITIIQRAVSYEANIQKAEFAAAIGCKVLIPHHQDLYGKDDPEILKKFKEEFLSRVPDGTFLIPEHGKWIEI